MSAVAASTNLCARTTGVSLSARNQRFNGAQIRAAAPRVKAARRGFTVKATVDATDFTFAKAIMTEDMPVLVYFWAPWCGPCKLSGPLFDEVAMKNATKCQAVKVNTDDYPSVASEYNIRNIPCVVVFRNGKVIDQVAGNDLDADLEGTVAKYV